jgi:hypothetical protein
MITSMDYMQGFNRNQRGQQPVAKLYLASFLYWLQSLTRVQVESLRRGKWNSKVRCSKLKFTLDKSPSIILNSEGTAKFETKFYYINGKIENITYTTNLMTIQVTREYIRYRCFHYICGEIETLSMCPILLQFKRQGECIR